MIPFNIDYENALDFEHCEDMKDALKRFSQLTNLMNRVISIRHNAKKDLLGECSLYPNEKMHKLGWDNKVVCLLSITKREQYIVDMVDLYSQADEAYKKLKLKHDQVIEDIMVLKKQIEITPR